MLKIQKENLEKSKVKLTVSLPPEMMVGYFKKIYDKLASTVEVKGFRRGKAPKNLTIMQIGENRIVSEIVDMALQETYPKALAQEKLIPIASPKIELKKMADLTGEAPELEYTAEIELLPEVEVGNYKKIRIKNKKSKNTSYKDEIDQVLSHLQRQHATFKDIDRPAKNGDRVEMDFEGKERGVMLENLSSKNYPVILGSKVLLPNFEKEILGMKKGEEKKFKANVEPDKKKPAKNIDFTVKVNNVQEVTLPKLDDAFAKKFEKKTIQDLTKAIEEDIIKQKDIKAKQDEEGELIEELLKISKVEVPESLIDQESNRMIEKLKEQTNMSGMTFVKYLEALKKTEEELKKDLRPQAEKTVKTGLVLGEIGKLEKIDLSKEDSGKKVLEKLLDYAREK